MAESIIEKHCETVSGWSLNQIVERVNELGAPFENVAIEPVSLGPGLMTVPAIVWYEKESNPA